MKRKQKPTCTIEELMAASLPLEVPPEEQILKDLKKHPDPRGKKIAAEIEAERKKKP